MIDLRGTTTSIELKGNATMFKRNLKSPMVHLILAAIVWSPCCTEAADPVDPSTQLDVPIENSGAASIIHFRLCPKGEILPGKPQPQNAKVKPVVMLPFYIAATEVTVAQFRAVLGDPAVDKIKQRYAKVLSKELVEEYDAALGDKGDRPVFFVTVDEAVAFCRRVEQAQAKKSQVGDGLEVMRLRLPSHIEWQYAARACASVSEASLRPHFNNWPDSLDAIDKTARAMCEEEWKEMAQPAAFTGSQEQVAAILEKRLLANPSNPKPKQILTGFLRPSINVDRDYSKTSAGKLDAAESDRANVWGIHGIHGGVCELVLSVNDGAAAAQFWLELGVEQQKSDVRSRPAFLCAGGSFDNSIISASSWEAFTIWGARPVDEKTGELKPFSLVEENAKNLTLDRTPGFRPIMLRVLSDDWLWLVRRDALAKSPAAETVKRLEAKRLRIRELAPESADANGASVDYYVALSLRTAGKDDEAIRTLAKARTKLLAGSKPDAEEKSRLLGALLAADNKPTSATKGTESMPQRSDDEVFLDTLAAKWRES